jgi:dihydrofolate reductase
MRKLIVTEFMSLDGVMEDPGGAEGFDRGGWAFQFDRGDEGDRFKFEELTDAGALLLGRATYEGFAAAWPGRTDDVGFADKMNGMPKYVISRTLETTDWNNSTILRGDVVEEVSGLKQSDGGNLLVAGSGQLVRALVEHDLVDELRLMVFPLIIGHGARLFGETTGTSRLRLTDVRPVGPDGVVVLTYDRSA